MKFGVREIANVCFRAKNDQKIGNTIFKKGQPIFYLDTAKTSTLEGAATTVYATGGRGNTRLIAWEGEKTLTFTVEDALLSPISFAILSGAGVVKGVSGEKYIKENGSNTVHFHQTTSASIGADGSIDLTDALEPYEQICPTAPIYVMEIDAGGDVTGKILDGFVVENKAKAGYEKTAKGFTVNLGNNRPTSEPTGDGVTLSLKEAQDTWDELEEKYYRETGKKLIAANLSSTENAATLQDGVTKINKAGAVLVDYYVLKNEASVTELQIDAESFGGYYYVEADTLFRRQQDGKDLPANITLPNVKIQSNFTFSMASTGDPSTFTFTMDATPGYTYFDTKRKILCGIQIVDDSTERSKNLNTVFPHPADVLERRIIESQSDSVNGHSTSSEIDDNYTLPYNSTSAETTYTTDQ